MVVRRWNGGLRREETSQETQSKRLMDEDFCLVLFCPLSILVSQISHFINALYSQLQSSSCLLLPASCLLSEGLQFMSGQVISFAFL